jgi:hypothetical protein
LKLVVAVVCGSDLINRIGDGICSGIGANRAGSDRRFGHATDGVIKQQAAVPYPLVTIAGDDHGALVRLASTGALVKDTGGEVTMLNQSRVRMKLELLERQQYSPALEMVEVED